MLFPERRKQEFSKFLWFRYARAWFFVPQVYKLPVVLEEQTNKMILQYPGKKSIKKGFDLMLKHSE